MKLKNWGITIVLGVVTFASLSMALFQETYYDKKAVTFLNNRTSSGGLIERDSLLYYLDKPLFSQDSAGKFHQVLTFMFTYVEVDVYISENGKPFIGSENMGTTSEKGVVPEDWIKIVKDNLKSGDSIIFSNPTSYLNMSDNNTKYVSPRLVFEIK